MDLKNKIVTVFGGSGFVGQNLVAALIKRGAIVRVPSRLKNAAYNCRTGALVGQVVPMQVDFSDTDSINACLDGADFAVNLIGILAETGHERFFKVHCDIAEKIAKSSKAMGVKHLVHMSALGADEKSESISQRSKAAGEKAAIKAFAKTTVLRPSIIFGEGDGFFSRFSKMLRFVPVMPLVGGGKTKFQPVYVGDVVDAIVTILTHHTYENIHGAVIECGGPYTYDFESLLKYIMDTTGVRRPLITLPFWLASFKAWFWERLPGKILTRDQVKSLKTDNILTGEHPNLEDIGVVPTPMEVIVPDYLEAYKNGGQFTHYRKV